MPKYTQKQFDEELAKMLVDAEKMGGSSVKIVAKSIHERVVSEGDNRVAMAANAMWKALDQHGGKVLHRTSSGLSSTLEMEFMLQGKTAPPLDEEEKKIAEESTKDDDQMNEIIAKRFPELEEKVKMHERIGQISGAFFLTVLATALVRMLFG